MKVHEQEMARYRFFDIITSIFTIAVVNLYADSAIWVENGAFLSSLMTIHQPGWNCLAFHSLCGSNKLLYKRCAKSVRRPKFRPPTAPTFFSQSFWN